MTSIDLARTALSVALAAVALYCAGRVAAWRLTHRGRSGFAGEPVADISHALMGAAMALMVAPLDENPVPAPLGVLVFGVLAAWFATILWHDGLMSRAGDRASSPDGWPGPDSAGRRRRATPAPGWSAAGWPLTSSTDGVAAREHGGYNLHHLAGCLAMIVMFATSHEVAADTAASTQHQVATAAGVHWLLGLYFLVAATSLGFRVGEPAVRLSYRMAMPAGPGMPPAPASRPEPARGGSRLMSSSAGRCASEVALSVGMALMFFASL